MTQVTVADLVDALRRARAEIARLAPLAARTEVAERECRRLAAENQRLRELVYIGHEWRREAGTHIFRCTSCGTRASEPREVLLTCEEIREARRTKKHGRGAA